MAYRAPKAIANHPAVETCECGEADASDYKHSIWLKDGWAFASGRNAGGRGFFSNNVRDFLDARPERIA